MTTWIPMIVSGIILASPLAFSQDQVSVRFLGGAYLFNSENGFRTTKDENLTTVLGGSLDYDHQVSSGIGVFLSLTYSSSQALDVLAIPVSTSSGMITGTTPADIRLQSYSLDVGVRYSILDWLEVRGGPSVAIINRSFVVESFSFEDELSSRAVGFNAGAHARIPFGSETNFAFVGGIGIQYFHSVWFDEAGRSLNNYSQNSTTATMSVGVSYRF